MTEIENIIRNMNIQNIPYYKQRIDELTGYYPEKRAALLPILWMIHDKEGLISDEAIKFIAEQIEISPAEVLGLVSFYTMFNRTPIGKYHIQVCTNLCCRLKGSDRILEYIKDKLSIEVGEITNDNLFYLTTVECLGSCGTSPMMQINNEYYEDLNLDKIDKILYKLKNEKDFK